MDNTRQALIASIARLKQALADYREREGFEDRVPAPRPPADEAEIVAYERHLGIRLPESYRIFLQLHDGYDWLAYPGHMLSIRSVMPGGEWYEDICEWKRDTVEYGSGEVLDGIVIATVDEATNWKLYLDPNRPSRQGELTVVEWTPNESYEYADLIEFFDELTLTWSEDDDIGEEIGEDEEDEDED